MVTDLTEGDGAEATAGSTVSVHYVGVAHSTGEEFDASYNRGDAAAVPPRHRPGHLRLGHRRAGHEGRRPPQLVIPPHLGYGDRGAGGAIKPGETLIFVVDLLEVS